MQDRTSPNWPGIWIYAQTTSSTLTVVCSSTLTGMCEHGARRFEHVQDRSITMPGQFEHGARPFEHGVRTGLEYGCANAPSNYSLLAIFRIRSQIVLSSVHFLRHANVTPKSERIRPRRPRKNILQTVKRWIVFSNWKIFAR